MTLGICFAQVLINGVLLGGLYAVMAFGLALVWGVLNIVNLAHGAFIMLGAYLAWHLYTYLGIDPFLRPAGTAIIMFLVGYAFSVACSTSSCGRRCSTRC